MRATAQNVYLNNDHQFSIMQGKNEVLEHRQTIAINSFYRATIMSQCLDFASVHNLEQWRVCRLEWGTLLPYCRTYGQLLVQKHGQRKECQGRDPSYPSLALASALSWYKRALHGGRLQREDDRIEALLA